MMPKQQILEELRRSRAAVARDAASVAGEINPATKIKKSVRLHPLAWLGGAAAIGWFLAGPKTRIVTKTSKGKHADPSGKSRTTAPRGVWGILLAIIKIAIPLARPVLSAYAARRLGDLTEKISR